MFRYFVVFNYLGTKGLVAQMDRRVHPWRGRRSGAGVWVKASGFGGGGGGGGLVGTAGQPEGKL